MLSQHVEELLAHGIDYQGAIYRFAGNEQLFEKFAFRFLEDPHYGQLKRALENGDVEESYREAHSLKGVVGNLSFTVLFSEVSAVSDVLSQAKLEEALALMPALDNAYDSAVGVLRRIQGTSSSF